MILALAATTAAFAHPHKGRSSNFTASGENCIANNFTWDGDEEAYVEKQVINGGSIRTLKATIEHAPVSVIGGNRAGYVIEACKVARRSQDLAAIRVTLDGGELRATGPEGERWFVQYRILVPDGANVDIATDNGPLAFRDVDGTVVARASNGPLSLRNLSGNVTATTTNGPISVSGGAGNMKVRAQNGPLSVDLEGTSWRGGTLDAATQNGPLSVEIPRGYGSGVVIESNGRGPLQCRAEGCERFVSERDDHDSYGRRHHDRTPRRIELGSGAEAVRLSTVNGPITVRDE
ncbi:MAG TPA: hypothetical protein VGF28_01870 [Thermoanaerobaculia bacterium]